MAINGAVNLTLNKTVDAALWSMENQPNKNPFQEIQPEGIADRAERTQHTIYDGRNY